MAYKQTIQANPDNAEANYSIACAYALKHQHTLALECLHKAIALDKRAFKAAETERNFESRRSHPAFEKLIRGK